MVLSDGTIVEPSQLARIAVVTTTGVESGEEGSPLAFSVGPAGPNPFLGSTSIRYATVSPRRASIAVCNAAGAKVRSLVDDILFGLGRRHVGWNHGRGRAGSLGNLLPAGRGGLGSREPQGGAAPVADSDWHGRSGSLPGAPSTVVTWTSASIGGTVAIHGAPRSVPTWEAAGLVPR